MCLIIVKKKGIEMPTKEFLKDVWEVNPHGAGIMWRNGKTRQVSFVKGLMKEEDMFDVLNRLDFNVDDEVAIHLRWATSGKIDKVTCHPFISSKNKKLRSLVSLAKTNKTLFMHNGIIDDLNDKKTISDTQRFARWYLPEVPLKKLYESSSLQKMITKFVDDSRLCILNEKFGILMTGRWVSGDNGLMLSKTFKKKDDSPWSTETFDYGWERDSLFYGEKIGYKTLNQETTTCRWCHYKSDEPINKEGLCSNCEMEEIIEIVQGCLPHDYGHTELKQAIEYVGNEYSLNEQDLLTVWETFDFEGEIRNNYDEVQQ